MDIINQLNYGKFGEYLMHKKETVREIRQYLTNTISKEYHTIINNIIGLEEKEILHEVDYLPEVCLIYNLSLSYEYLTKDLRFRLIKIIIYSINKANGKDMFNYVNRIFKCISKNSNVLSRLMDILFSFEKMKEVLFYQYVDQNFKTMTDIDDLIKEVDFWNANSSMVLTDNHYMENAATKTKNIVENNRNREECIQKIKDNFDKLLITEDFKINMIKIYKSSEEALLKTIDLDYITLEQIKNLADNVKYVDETKTRIIKYVNYAFAVLKPKKLDQIFDEFYMVEKSEIYFIKKILKRLLREEIKQENYTLIVFAHTDFNEFCKYDSLIEYLGQDDKEKLYEFIHWSFNCGIFRNKRTATIDKLYLKALKEYLVNEDKKIVKNKRVLKEYFTHEESKKIIEEIKFEIAGPIKKLMFKASEV